MEIHSGFEYCDPLFLAIKASPFSETFKALFIDEILTTPGLWFGSASVNGIFDCSDIATSETGNLLVKVRLSRFGELMTSAFLALSCATEEKGGHLDTPSIFATCAFAKPENV